MDNDIPIGCWIASTAGDGDTRLCMIAADYGWRPEPDDSTFRMIVSDGFVEVSWQAEAHELMDEAEEYLNEHVAPTGYRFGWVDGEFMLWSDEYWEKAYSDHYGLP